MRRVRFASKNGGQNDLPVSTDTGDSYVRDGHIWLIGSINGSVMGLTKRNKRLRLFRAAKGAISGDDGHQRGRLAGSSGYSASLMVLRGYGADLSDYVAHLYGYVNGPVKS